MMGMASRLRAQQDLGVMERMAEADAARRQSAQFEITPRVMARMKRQAGDGSNELLVDGRRMRADDPFWAAYEAFLAERCDIPQAGFVCLGDPAPAAPPPGASPPATPPTTTPDVSAAVGDTLLEGFAGVIIGALVGSAAIGATIGMGVAAATSGAEPAKYGKGAAIGAGLGLVAPFAISAVKGALG